MRHVKKELALLLASVILLSLCACGTAPVKETAAAKDTSPAQNNSAAQDDSAAVTVDEDFTIPASAVPVDLSRGSFTVTEPGDYVVSGELANGQLTVDVPHEKIHLFLNGASVTCSSSAALYVKSAKKVTLVLCEGTENSFVTAGTFAPIDDNNIDAAVFSKGDITVKGTGVLNVECPQGHGIVSKDELKISSGTVNVRASGHGINGKDSLTVLDGRVDVVAGKSALRSNNEEPGMGNVTIEGGMLTLSGGTNAIKAVGTVAILGGSVLGVGGTGSIEGNIDEASQGTVYVSYEAAQTAGSTIAVAGKGGETAAQFTAGGDFRYLLCSVPGMVRGEKYSITCNGVSSTEAVF